MGSGKICEIEVGFDRFRALLIIEACEAAGVEARLRQMDENGLTPGLIALQQHRIMIHCEDELIAQSIVDQSIMSEPESRAWTGSPSMNRKLLAWGLVGVVLVPVTVNLLRIVQWLL